jgi:hypothetical protein
MRKKPGKRPKLKLIPLRISPKLHIQLVQARRARGLSMKYEIQARLRESFNQEILFQELRDLRSSLIATIDAVLRAARQRETEQAWRQELERQNISEIH